eukprot:m.305571 g.305571  ORF g.305571 m.305571 type:complete len:65 (-) comp15909_c4_seq1:611-805(-)
MKAPSHGTPLGEPCARNLQDGSTCSTLQNRTRAGNVSSLDVLQSMFAAHRHTRLKPRNLPPNSI